jgi:hypothetical protein
LRDVVGGLRVAATGPTRLRACLRRSTRPIRRSRDGLAIGGLRTTFPEEIFGGELLGVLGEQLRTVLSPPAAPLDEEAALRSSLRAARERGFGAGVLARQPAAAGLAAGREPRVPELTRSRRGLDVETRPDSGPAGLEARAGAGRATEIPPSPAGAALLEHRLRLYWAAVRAAESRPFERSPAATSLRPSAPLRERREDGSTRPPTRRPSEADLARELHAFVTDRPVVRTQVEHDAVPADGELEPWPSVEAVAPPATRRLDVPVRGTPRSPRTGPSGLEPREHAAGLRELAEEMASILREQVIRHGIDVP